jgi:hypothetical protein
MNDYIILPDDPWSFNSYSRTKSPASGDTLNHATIKECLKPMQDRLSRINRHCSFFKQYEGTVSAVATSTSTSATEMRLAITELSEMNFSYIKSISVRLHILFGTKFAIEGFTAPTYKSNLIRLEIKEVVDGSYGASLGYTDCGSPSYTSGANPDWQFSNVIIVSNVYTNPSFTSLAFQGFQQIVSGITTAGYNQVGITKFQMNAFVNCTFNRS